MSYAQFVPVYLSFFVYLIIFYLILFKKSYLFEKNYLKFLGALICLVAPTLSFEIWLNAINIQVYFGILGLIILFLKEDENNYTHSLLLFIGGFSGIYTCLLTPLFFLKYIYKKNFYDLLNFIILAFCCLIQLILIFYISAKVIPIGSQVGNTSLTFTLSKFEIISFFYNVIIRSFFGSTLPTFLASLYQIELYNVFNEKNILNLLFFISTSLLILSTFLIYFLYNFLKKKEEKIIYISLLALFVLTSFIVIFGGDTNSLHGRYSSLPSIILIFIILHISNSINYRFIKIFSTFLIISTVFFGLIDFRMQEYIMYFDCINCPDWNDEVRKYKLDNSYQLNAWPYHIGR